jgi:glycine/D-amino acid oxidase-like deaminating enzyme
MATKIKKAVVQAVPEVKTEKEAQALAFSKRYGYQNLSVAKHLFNEFVKRWDVNAQPKPSVYRLLNEGFRQIGYIRLKKQPGQRLSDAMQMFEAWLQDVDIKVQEDIRRAHKQQFEEYTADAIAQMFPAREVKFGTCDPELGEVEDDTDSY